jgi:hypothetical protein
MDNEVQTHGWALLGAVGEAFREKLEATPGLRNEAGWRPESLKLQAEEAALAILQGSHRLIGFCPF